MRYAAIWSDSTKKDLYYLLETMSHQSRNICTDRCFLATILVSSSIVRLPSDAQMRILDKTIDAENDLFRHFARLTNEPLYKYRVGDYRVIADVVNSKLILHLLKVKKRSKVYKLN